MSSMLVGSITASRAVSENRDYNSSIRARRINKTIHLRCVPPRISFLTGWRCGSLREPQIGKVPFGSWSDPQCHGAFAVTVF
jgi:hypothetical protein